MPRRVQGVRAPWPRCPAVSAECCLYAQRARDLSTLPFLRRHRRAQYAAPIAGSAGVLTVYGPHRISATDTVALRSGVLQRWAAPYSDQALSVIRCQYVSHRSISPQARAGWLPARRQGSMRGLRPPPPPVLGLVPHRGAATAPAAQEARTARATRRTCMRHHRPEPRNPAAHYDRRSTVRRKLEKCGGARARRRSLEDPPMAAWTRTPDYPADHSAA